MQYYIKAKQFLLENEIRYSGYLLVQDGKFGAFVEEIPAGAHVVDWSDYIIAPGLFDTHIHGINGHDVMDGTVEAINEISTAILAKGVTRFLPTTLTSSNADLERAIISVTKAVHTGLPGAQSEGIFLEGPYFTEKHKGAQNPIYFKDPNERELQKWQKLAQNSIVKIALAPERNNSLDFIRSAKNDGVFVSIAHSDADYDCCNHAIKSGANIFVHLFNGMTGLHHREPGVVGAAFNNPEAYAEIICDGFHVHPDIATLALRIKDDKLVLITDCMRAGLMPDGEYMLGEYQITMEKGIARTSTGSLAGSTLLLKDGIKNLQQWSHEPLYKIWHLGSLSPAESVGKGSRFGSISPGKLADYVVLDDDLNVQVTAVEGEIKYKKSS